MEIRILGCSGGIGKGLRTTCMCLDQKVLLDCGTGVGDLEVDQLANIKHVFLTHSHLDHIAGLPLLIDTIYASLLHTPLTVYCLPETYQALSQHIFNNVIWPNFFALPSQQKPVVRVQVVQPGEQVCVEELNFTVLSACHTVPAVAYHIDDGRAGFIFSGDTTSSDAFWQQVRQRTPAALIIECAFPEDEADIAALAMHYHPSLLARDLRALNICPDLYVSHLQPGREVQTMQQLRLLLPEFRISSIRGGDILSL